MAREKPFEKLRPNTQKAIRNETKRKMEGRYPRTWIDAALGIDDPPWWWQGVTWLPGRAVPAFLTGGREVLEGIDLMFNMEETELLKALDTARTNARIFKQKYGKDSWQYQHVKKRVDELYSQWLAEDQKRLGIEVLHQQILDEADPPPLRALRKQAEEAFDDGRGYMSKEHRDAVKAYNEAKAKLYPTPVWDAFKANYSKYKLWTAEGREKFWTTLVNRPDEIVGDVSVFAPYLKASKIGAVAKTGKWVDRLDPGNVLGVVEEVVQETNKLKPLLRSTTPFASVMKERFSEGLGRTQLERWDADPNVYFIITSHDSVDIKVGSSHYVTKNLDKSIDIFLDESSRAKYPSLWVFRGKPTGANEFTRRFPEYERVQIDEIIEKHDFDTADFARRDLVSGVEIDKAQFDEWDADENIFYRITNESRLDQKVSHALAESDDIHKTVLRRMPSDFSGFAPTMIYSDFLSDDTGRFMSYNEAMTRWRVDGRDLDDLTKDYKYWDAYRAIAEDLDVIPVDVPRIPGSRFAPAKFQYKGVNGSGTLDEIEKYSYQSDWKDFVKKENDRSVLQVIQGKKIGETYDDDGDVIVPEKTIAVFDLNIIR